MASRADSRYLPLTSVTRAGVEVSTEREAGSRPDSCVEQDRSALPRKASPARPAADTRRLLESRVSRSCQFSVLGRSLTVNVLVKINHALPCL